MRGIPLPDMTGKSYDEIIYAGGSGDGSPALRFDAGYLTPLEYYDKRLNKHFVHFVTLIPDEKGLTKNLVFARRYFRYEREGRRTYQKQKCIFQYAEGTRYFT